MAKGDVAGNLLSQISHFEPSVILWDLCDERGGVIRLAGGDFITSNLIYAEQPIEGEAISIRNDEHFELWKKALDQFLRSLKGIRVVVNATPWALSNDHGEPVNGNSAKAANFNATIERYLVELEDRGLEVIRIDQSKAVSRVDHKWGEAPFHYVDETYREMLVRLKALVG